MPQYLYVLKVTRPAMLSEGPTEAESAALARHVEHLSASAARGEALLFGRTQTTTPDTMGLVILNAADDDAARAAMEADPAVAEGVMTATLYPYSVAGMAAPEAFERG